MNRRDFQKLAQIRLNEAVALFKNGCFSGAYYLAGYAIECGLKACIAKKTRQYDFPPDRRTIEGVYTHDLERLVKSAGLDLALDEDLRSNKKLAQCWAVVKDWSEQSRYEEKDRQMTADLLDAIAGCPDGVLQWIKRRW